MHIPRKITVALLAGVSIAGLAGASAASLGTLTSSQIGTGNAVVASCDQDGMDITYATTYNPSVGFVVTGLNFANVNSACNGQNASIVLKGALNATLGTQNAGAITVASNSFTVPLTTAVSAELLQGVSVIIAN
jgi:hypothetical protein